METYSETTTKLAKKQAPRVLNKLYNQDHKFNISDNSAKSRFVKNPSLEYMNKYNHIIKKLTTHIITICWWWIFHTFVVIVGPL